MENLVTSAAWQGRSVFVTGHTGFKGGWLCLWLHELGAEIHGYSLDPPTAPSFFDVARIKSVLAADTRGDLAHLSALASAMSRSRAQLVVHLAAQPLVRESYSQPLATLATNVMGTAHVLEAARACDSVRAVLVITSDKVYQNREWPYPYRELDPLGGHDPYSASKAAAEILTASYRDSFFTRADGHHAGIATARAGNVIGGGDWAADRLVPDCLRAFAANEPVHLRFPNALRPWQHVLEPLAGYLRLAECLRSDRKRYARAWNFGPHAASYATVGELARMLAGLWGQGARVVHDDASDLPHEAGLLRLDSTCAQTELGWRPRWNIEQALAQTISWDRAWRAGADMKAFSLDQVRQYRCEARP